MKSSIRVTLDTRYNRGDDLYPVKIGVTFIGYENGVKKWLPKFYSIGIYLSEEHFKRATGNGRIADKELSKVRDDINAKKAKAEKIMATAPNPEQFKTLFTSMGSLHNVIDHFDRYAKQCEEEGRIGSRDSYNNAAASFVAFSSKGLTFAEINVNWLKRYESWALNKGMSINTIGIYLRNLRAIFNQVINEPYRIVPQEQYPFGRGGYKIKKKRGGKWAPSWQEIKKVLDYHTLDPKIRKARAFWMFSYFGYGLNPADIARIRFCDIVTGEIHLTRTKTINTEHEGKVILIPVHAEMKKIIQEFGAKTLNKKEYIFPVLSAGLTPNQVKNRIHDFKAEVNAGLKSLCNDLEIEGELKFGTARHAFATTLKRKGAPISFIKDALGHGSEGTTEHYLAAFDREKRDEMSRLLG